VGGSAQQWQLLLTEDLVPGSPYDLWLTIGKAGDPARIEWELLIVDPTAAPAPESATIPPC
jgi:hypothetical protein